jgi:TonB family protein
MKDQNSDPLFQLIEPRRLSVRSLAGGLAVQAVLLTAALVWPLFSIQPIALKRYDVMMVTPVLSTPPEKPIVKREPLVMPQLPRRAPVVAQLPLADELRLPEIKSRPAPLIAEARPFEPIAIGTNPSGRPRGVVAGSGFESASGAGGGGADRAGARSKAAVAGAGFDGASGTGGGGADRTGARPRVAVVGGGFEAVAFGSPSPQPARREVKPAESPVEIINKPRPEYTEEARRMKIEGEVALRVLFSSSGKVRVMNLIQGLGYGLDENAIRAAQEIQFKPASWDGQPVDSTAIVRIAFLLAY